MAAIETLGFMGIGVMGEPMCENLARKSKRSVYATDLRHMPLNRLAAAGVNACGSVSEVAANADPIFLSLPGGNEVEEICTAIPPRAKRHAPTVVHCSTTPRPPA